MTTPAQVVWLVIHLQGDLVTEVAMTGRKQWSERTAMAEQHPETVPAAMQPAYEAIVNGIEAVCREHLNDDYAALSRQLAAALARK